MRITPSLPNTAIPDGTETSHPKNETKPNNNVPLADSTNYSRPNPQGARANFLARAGIDSAAIKGTKKARDEAKILATPVFDHAAHNITNSLTNALGNYFQQLLKSLDTPTISPAKKMEQMKETLLSYKTVVESVSALYQNSEQLNDEQASALMNKATDALSGKTFTPESLNAVLDAFLASPRISNGLKQAATKQLVEKYLNSPPSMESAVGIADLMMNYQHTDYFPSEKVEEAIKFIADSYAEFDVHRNLSPEAQTAFKELKSSWQQFDSYRKAIPA